MKILKLPPRFFRALRKVSFFSLIFSGIFAQYFAILEDRSHKKKKKDRDRDRDGELPLFLWNYAIFIGNLKKSMRGRGLPNFWRVNLSH